MNQKIKKSLNQMQNREIDYLMILKRTAFYFLNFTFLDKFLKFSIWAHAILCSLELTYLLNHDAELIIDCGHIFALHFFCVAISSEVFRQRKSFVALEDDFNILHINLRNRSFKDRVNRNAKAIVVIEFVVSISFLLFSMSVFQSLLDPYFVIVYISDEYFSAWQKYFILIPYQATLFFVMVLTLAGPLLFLYSYIRIQAHRYSVTQELLTVPERFRDVEEVELRKSNIYQEDVYKKLCKFFREQRNVDFLKERLAEITSVVCVLVFLFGFMTMIIMMYCSLYQYSNKNFGYFLAIAPTFVMTILTCQLFWMSGQGVENESAEIFDFAYQTHWYIWNKKNRQALQIFMANNLKPREIVVGGLFALNYEFSAQLTRRSISMALTFYQLAIKRI